MDDTDVPDLRCARGEGEMDNTDEPDVRCVIE